MSNVVNSFIYGRALFPVGSLLVGADDSVFARFLVLKSGVEFGSDVDLREFHIIKHIDYPEPYPHENVLYEVHAKRSKDDVPMVALVLVHKCPHYSTHEKWRVYRYTDFKPYQEGKEKKAGVPPLHLFEDRDFEVECLC